MYLGISDRRFKQFLEVFVTILLVIPGFPPLRDRLPVEDQNVEEGIQQQNYVWFDRHAVEQDGLGRDIECV